MTNQKQKLKRWTKLNNWTMPIKTLALLSKHKQRLQKQREMAESREGGYPEELSVDADPFKQNGDNETIRPKLVSSVPV